MEEQNKRLIKPDHFDIGEVLNSLQGSCNTLSDVLETLYEIDEEALTNEDRQYIGNEIFRCDVCGWWYEISEQEDDNTCSDCYEKKIEDIDDSEDYEGEDDD